MTSVEIDFKVVRHAGSPKISNFKKYYSNLIIKTTIGQINCEL